MGYELPEFLTPEVITAATNNKHISLAQTMCFCEQDAVTTTLTWQTASPTELRAILDGHHLVKALCWELFWEITKTNRIPH